MDIFKYNNKNMNKEPIIVVMGTFRETRTHITHPYIHWKSIMTGPCHCLLTSYKWFLLSMFCQVRYCYVSINIPNNAFLGISWSSRRYPGTLWQVWKWDVLYEWEWILFKFCNVVMGCAFLSTADSFVILLFTLTWLSSTPFCHSISIHR